MIQKGPCVTYPVNAQPGTGSEHGQTARAPFEAGPTPASPLALSSMVMSACQFCGAPISRSPDKATTCTFCGRTNDPLPREVQVPVPVQVVQNVVQVVGGSTTLPAELRCPHCRKRLMGVVAKEVELNGCAGCGGIWIDNRSARRVLAAPEEIFAELASRAGSNAKKRAVRAQNPACPVCTAVLDQVTTHGIELDTCSEHGTWFDAFELARLVHVLSGRATEAKVRLGDTREILCASCRTPLTANRANISPEGLVCDACWRSQEAKQIAAADQATRTTGAVAVGGALLGIAAVMLGAAASGSRGS
jgi:Zn-finger nucleic acid-binding protein